MKGYLFIASIVLIVLISYLPMNNRANSHASFQSKSETKANISLTDNNKIYQEQLREVEPEGHYQMIFRYYEGGYKPDRLDTLLW